MIWDFFCWTYGEKSYAKKSSSSSSKHYGGVGSEKKSHASKWNTRVILFHSFHSLDLGAFNGRFVSAYFMQFYLRTFSGIEYVQMPKYVYNFICLTHLWIESTLEPFVPCLCVHRFRYLAVCAQYVRCCWCCTDMYCSGCCALTFVHCFPKLGMVEINYLWNIFSLYPLECLTCACVRACVSVCLYEFSSSFTRRKHMHRYVRRNQLKCHHHHTMT